MLKSEIVALAREIYGSLAPNASFHGQLGEDGKDPLFVYVMNRIPGISHLDFVLTNGFPENSDDNFLWRKTLMSDVARLWFSLRLSLYFENRTIKMPLHPLQENANWLQFFCPLLESPSKGLIQITARIYAENIPRICNCYFTTCHLAFTRSFKNALIQWMQFSLCQWFFSIAILVPLILWSTRHLVA